MTGIRKMAGLVPSRLRNLRLDDDGATAIEYGLITALIAVSIIGSLMAITESLSTTFDEAKVEVQTTG